MSQVESVDARTTDSEQKLAVAHPAMFRNHPAAYTGLLILLVGGVVGAGFAYAAEQWVLVWVSAAVSAIGLCGFVYWWIYNHCTILTVTTERTIYRRGILSRHTNEVQHDDVKNMHVDQNLFQRIFGIGDVAISSAGQGDMEIMARGITNPVGIVETIRRYQ